MVNANEQARAQSRVLATANLKPYYVEPRQGPEDP